MFTLGTSSAGPPEEYTARLDVEIDSARQGWSFKLWTLISWLDLIVWNIYKHLLCQQNYWETNNNRTLYTFKKMDQRIFWYILFYFTHVLLFDILGPTISSIALKALEGIVRLHTPHKLQVSICKVRCCYISSHTALGTQIEGGTWKKSHFIYITLQSTLKRLKAMKHSNRAHPLQ